MGPGGRRGGLEFWAWLFSLIAAPVAQGKCWYSLNCPPGPSTYTVFLDGSADVS
jgi:hypothetical protein